MASLHTKFCTLMSIGSRLHSISGLESILGTILIRVASVLDRVHIKSSIFSCYSVQANFLFHGSDYLETSRAWIMHLSCVIPLMGLHEFNWAQVASINPLRAYLNFFARALVTGPTGTWVGSEYALSHLLVIVLSLISSPTNSYRHLEN